MFLLCIARSGDGLASMPAGGARLSATMKSSRLMGSDVETFSSDDFRSWAMPLGALFAELPGLNYAKKSNKSAF